MSQIGMFFRCFSEKNGQKTGFFAKKQGGVARREGYFAASCARFTAATKSAPVRNLLWFKM